MREKERFMGVDGWMDVKMRWRNGEIEVFRFVLFWKLGCFNHLFRLDR